MEAVKNQSERSCYANKDKIRKRATVMMSYQFMTTTRQRRREVQSLFHLLIKQWKKERKFRNQFNCFPVSIPTFNPLHIESERANKKGSANGHCFRPNELRSPINIVQRFFNSSMLDTIETNTNKYAARKRDGKGRPWRENNAPELNSFIGIIIYTGVFRSSRTTDYWNRDGRSPTHKITQYMALTSFNQLKRYLHICDPSGDNGKSFSPTKQSHFLRIFQVQVNSYGFLDVT